MEKLCDLEDGREVYTDGINIFIREDIVLIIPSNEEAQEILNIMGGTK